MIIALVLGIVDAIPVRDAIRFAVVAEYGVVRAHARTAHDSLFIVDE